MIGSNDASTRGRGVERLAAVALAPLRAVERARGWRRLAILALYGLIGLTAGALLWRRAQLAGLPEVGPPPAAASAPVPVGPDALALYRRAAERFRDLSMDEERSFTAANLDWSRADPTLRAWVADCADAIALLREGSARGGTQPGRLPGVPTEGAEVADGPELVRRLSWVGTAALLEAGRLQAEGDRAGAWSLLAAAVRAGRHMEWIAPRRGRVQSMMLNQFALGPVTDWALDPDVDLALLRKALDDLTAAEALTPPASLTYRARYRAAEAELADLTPMIAASTRRRGGSGPLGLYRRAAGLEAFLRGEPERSRRVLHLLAANDLAWCDRPADRPAPAVPRLLLYAADPSTPSAARALPPEELARWADSALVTASLDWRLGYVEPWNRTDRWSLGQLSEVVAVTLFTREQGRPPNSPAEAFLLYRPLPGTSPGRDEAKPVTERAASQAGSPRLGPP